MLTTKRKRSKGTNFPTGTTRAPFNMCNSAHDGYSGFSFQEASEWRSRRLWESWTNRPSLLYSRYVRRASPYASFSPFNFIFSFYFLRDLVVGVPRTGVNGPVQQVNGNSFGVCTVRCCIDIGPVCALKRHEWDLR